MRDSVVIQIFHGKKVADGDGDRVIPHKSRQLRSTFPDIVRGARAGTVVQERLNHIQFSGQRREHQRRVTLGLHVVVDICSGRQKQLYQLQIPFVTCVLQRRRARLQQYRGRLTSYQSINPSLQSKTHVIQAVNFHLLVPQQCSDLLNLPRLGKVNQFLLICS